MIWLLVAACGFAPNARDVPAPAADGKGPFRDDGPIEICEGSVRLVPPDPSGTDGAGVCAPPDGPPAASCASNAACGARERCVCGRCTTPRCRSARDCPDAWTCDLVTRVCQRTCFDDADCGAGEACEPEGCRPRCGADGDCARGEVCLRSSGLCAVQRCEAGLACAGGRTCDAVERFADLREPDVVAAGGTRELYVEEATGAGSVVLRAVSTDGTSFVVDPPGPVLEDAGAPSVVARGSLRILFYARPDGTIGRADGDGRTFEASPDPVLADAGRAPSATADGDVLTLAYERDDGIVVVRGPIDGPLAPVAGPIDSAFFEDPEMLRDVGDLGSPELVRRTTALAEPLYLLYADATGVETSDIVLGDEPRAPPRTPSIVLAAAGVDLAFAPYPFGPVFARVVNVTDYRSETEPSVVFAGGEALLYYVGGDEGVSRATQVAAGP